jgi:bifunctional UDP-N-acetylglucosamine pyrophosphorylase/glucosamine-1-phosphate N-acetyltransferase
MGRPPLSAIVLAAGDGTRMRSSRPKALHVFCGKAMVVYVLDALVDAAVDRTVVVVGAGAERVTKKLQQDGPDLAIEFVEQRFARGTGDAASVGLTAFEDDNVLDETSDDAQVLVLPGNMPLLRPATLRRLVDEHVASGAAGSVLTVTADDPSGRARVVRGKADRVTRIVEPNDPEIEELDAHEVHEVPTGIYCFRRNLLAPALRRIDPRHSRGIYELSDTVRVLADAGHSIHTVPVTDASETLAVDDRVQLARVEAELRRRTNLGWLERGVTFVDPDKTYLDTTVQLGADVTIFPGTILQGRTVVGEGCEIGPNTRLVDCSVGAGAEVQETVGRDAFIGAGARVGPFAVLEPGSEVASGTVTGAFYTSGARDD